MIGLLPLGAFSWVDDGSRSVYDPESPAHGPYAIEETRADELAAMQKMGLTQQQIYDCLRSAREERRVRFLSRENYALKYLEERMPDGRIRIRNKVWAVEPLKGGK